MAKRKAPKRKPRPKSRRGKPLRASSSHRRTAARATLPAPLPFEGVVATYMEFPGRLLACRTPLQVWFEYLQLGQRVTSALAAPFAVRRHPLPR